MILDYFPLPPSSNQLYSSFRGRLIKSKIGRAYDVAVLVFELKNMKYISDISRTAKELKTLKINTTFVFHRARVIGKKGQMKRIDASNRIKQVHDHLAKLIGIDDCYFVEGSFSKATCKDIKDERVIIEITKGDLVEYD